MPREKYTFQLSTQEAQIVVSGLRELPAPMRVIEPIVKTLEEQFQEQLAEDERQNNAAKTVENNDNNTTASDTNSASA